MVGRFDHAGGPDRVGIVPMPGRVAASRSSSHQILKPQAEQVAPSGL
jgi:hypothetical protein